MWPVPAKLLNNEMKKDFSLATIYQSVVIELSWSRIGHWSNPQTISNDLLRTNETVLFTICPPTACSLGGDITCTVYRNETAVMECDYGNISAQRNVPHEWMNMHGISSYHAADNLKWNVTGLVFKHSRQGVGWHFAVFIIRSVRVCAKMWS